jgi:hypothetical protein
LTATLTTLVNFNGANGANPRGNLIADANGDLFGTTSDGGTVFELVKSGSTYTLKTLVNFTSGLSGSLTADANGDLFGATLLPSTVFELVKSGSTYTLKTLFTFDGGPGFEPSGSLIVDANGDLFGTARSGGVELPPFTPAPAFGIGTVLGGAFGFIFDAIKLSLQDGTVFELVKSGSTYTLKTLVNFNDANGANGAHPNGGLIADANGDLFGTTSAGGNLGFGTVFQPGLGTAFELVKGDSGYTLKTLVNFNGVNGANPEGSLIADANGDLFGTTSAGGIPGSGTVFELVKENTGYFRKTLVNFNGVNGAAPHGSLIADANGDLFGTTSAGGTDDRGTVFELVKSGSGYAFKTLVNFTGVNGWAPEDSLIADANGDLFGTTSRGGTGHLGTVFEITNTGFVPFPHFEASHFMVG